MAKLKTYAIGINTHVHSDIFAMLDQPNHIRQARVLVVAPNKAAAINYPSTLPGRWVGTPYTSEVRVASGNDVDALAVAGVLDAPAAFVIPHTGWPGSGVVRVDADGPKLIGHLNRANGTVQFEPVGTVTVKFSPDAVSALASLLGLVHYDDLAQSWRNMLPGELLDAMKSEADDE
ncbi:hypothetical protein AB0I89_23995 [Micromonospora sp. NPDC049801]|uniref:hypothetical protein n=1 Tax=unclassified Micromonospora TaxID=2617518 RepID=UPI0034033B86